MNAEQKRKVVMNTKNVNWFGIILIFIIWISGCITSIMLKSINPLLLAFIIMGIIGATHRKLINVVGLKR